MGGFDSSWFISISLAFVLTIVPLCVAEKWRKKASWVIAILALFTSAVGVQRLLSAPRTIVKPSEKYLKELGDPFPVARLSYPRVYQGLFQNGFVIWIDGRFFELALDGQYWHSFPDKFPTDDPEWFSKVSLKKYFPECEDRLPIAGIAKAMVGPQKQFYSWLGCLQAVNSSSVTEDVTLQPFRNGYVIEGVLDPPQSSLRKRFILLNGGEWDSENMDSRGKWAPINPN